MKLLFLMALLFGSGYATCPPGQCLTPVGKCLPDSAYTVVDGRCVKQGRRPLPAPKSLNLSPASPKNLPREWYWFLSFGKLASIFFRRPSQDGCLYFSNASTVDKSWPPQRSESILSYRRQRIFFLLSPGGTERASRRATPESPILVPRFKFNPRKGNPCYICQSCWRVPWTRISKQHRRILQNTWDVKGGYTCPKKQSSSMGMASSSKGKTPPAQDVSEYVRPLIWNTLSTSLCR